jgi:hypothetical protein
VKLSWSCVILLFHYVYFVTDAGPTTRRTASALAWAWASVPVSARAWVVVEEWPEQVSAAPTAPASRPAGSWGPVSAVELQASWSAPTILASGRESAATAVVLPAVASSEPASCQAGEERGSGWADA